MKRSRYLLAYDIRDPRRLRQVHTTATAYGSALQYSVFVCDLNPGGLVKLRMALRETMNAGEDSVMLLHLGDGYDRRSFEFMGVAPNLPSGGAVVI